ncbi:zinc finger, CCHC-type containing protein [Tanacetum coccineum]
MTTTVVNNSVFRAFFEKQRLTEPNFIDWYRNLRIVLSLEDKLTIFGAAINAYASFRQLEVKASKEIVGLMLMTMDPDIQKNLEQLGAYDMLKELKALYAQKEEHELIQTVREFHACKHEEGQFVSYYFLKIKIYIDNLEHLGHAMTQNLAVSLILVSLRKEYDSFVQNYNMHGMGKTVTELHAMLKLHEQTLPKKEVTPALHAIRAGKNKKLSQGASTSGLRGSRKLKPGALSLSVSDGHRVTVEAIGTYHLCLPSGLVLVLHNCHYAPSITRGIISVSRFAIPRNGIFEIDWYNSNTNDCSMYAVSNKRAKINLDSTLLWHCRLGHISKKRIEKLQHDGLLNLTVNQSFDKCVPCMSRKMEHEIIAHRTPPYTPQHNGVSERRSRTLLDMVSSMMSQTTLPKSFWDYALESAARILNMVPTKKVEKTPYEVWHWQAPKRSYLKVKGCEALVKSTRTRHAPNHMCLYIDDEEHELGDHDELANYKDALLDPKSNKWLDVMNVELQSMKDSQV